MGSWGREDSHVRRGERGGECDVLQAIVTATHDLHASSHNVGLNNA